MRQEPVDIIGCKMIFRTQLFEILNTQGNDVFSQQACILLHGEQGFRQPVFLGIRCPTIQMTIKVLVCSCVHTGLFRIGKGCDIYPVHTKRQTIRDRLMLEQQGEGTIRQHPTQEILLEREHRLILQQCQLLGLFLEIGGLHPWGQSLRSDSHSIFRHAHTHGHKSIFQGIDTCTT